MNIWIYGHRCEYCFFASIHIPLPGVFFVIFCFCFCFCLAALVLGCVWALSSRSGQGLLSKSRCTGFLVQWLPLLQSTGSRAWHSLVVRGLSCPEACGIVSSWTRYQTCVPCTVSSVQFSVQFSHSVVSNSSRPHESQHTRPPCPSPTPRVHSDSHPSSR